MNSNLESKINLLFQFLYDDLDTDCFNISRVNLKNIKIDDIKIPTNYKNREIILEDLMNANFQLKESHENISVFRRLTNGFATMFTLSPYYNKEKENEMNVHNNNESLFSYVLSELVLQEKTKNILLPIINIDVKFEEIRNILKAYPIFKHYNKLIEEEEIKDLFSLRLKEHFYPNQNLEKYMQENKLDNIKDIIFQTIHCLSVIQDEYDSFRHNNLDISTIYIQKDNIPKDKVFISSGQKYNIRDSNVTVKIGSFENAECKEINGKTSKNKYSDVFNFLKSIKTSNFYEKLDDETKNFIKDMLASNDEKEYIIPKNIIKNKYFNEYKKISNETYMNSKFKNFSIMDLESDNIDQFGYQDRLNSDKYSSESFTETKLVRKEKKKGSKKNSYRGIRRIKKSTESSDNSSVKSNKYTRSLKQHGGEFRKSDGPYRNEKNSPYISNDARDTYSKFKREKPEKSYEPPVLAEQKIYDTQKQSKPKPQDYIANTIPINNPYNMHYHPQFPWESKPNTVNVVKPVNITFSNPVNGNHLALNRVYEDMLPGDHYTFSLRSTFERTQLTGFIRGMILETGDGEELSVTAGGKRSLLSYIRLLEINPYNIEVNPYKSLSKGFLLYSSAYPVRYDRERNHLGLAKESLGINVRIYQLSRGAYEAERIGENINCDDFDVWREIKYYEYVREDIVKRKISPNFVTIYLYTTDSNSRINYDQLDIIRSKDKPNEAFIKERDNLFKINKKHEVDPLQFLISNSFGINHKQFNNDKYVISDYIPTQEKLDNLGKYLSQHKYIVRDTEGNDWLWTETGISFLGSKNYFKLDFTGKQRPGPGKKVTSDQVKILAMAIGKVDYSIGIEKSLIALTESPNSPLISWASPSSENFGTVQKMTETGYHTPQVWKSVIFQLVYTFAVLQKKNIYFKKLSLENNFFIKDLFTNNEKRDHWIYKAKNINFYIPNYGYLLMFDSKYLDIMEDQVKTVGVVPNDDLKYKIQSTTLYSKNELDQNEVNDEIYSAFKDTINPNKITSLLSFYGGLKPSTEVTNLLQNLYDYNDPNRSIENYLEKFFIEFMHNKIGKQLTVDEMSIVGNIYIHNFKRGELVAYRKGNGDYRWAIYLGVVNRNLCKIATKENDAYVEKDIQKGTVLKVPESETIKQDSVNRVLYDSEYTIETYSLQN